MDPSAYAFLGAGLGAGIALIGGGLGIGKLAASAMEGIARQPQGAVADQPGAQQRRGLQVRVAVRDREAEPLVRDGRIGEAAVAVVTLSLIHI